MGGRNIGKYNKLTRPIKNANNAKIDKAASDLTFCLKRMSSLHIHQSKALNNACDLVLSLQTTII